MEKAEKLPEGWIKVKSKSKAGKFYFFNKKLNASVWKIEDLTKFGQNEKVTSEKKTPKKALPNLPLKTAASSKVIKKNIAKDRLDNLQKKLRAEIKVTEIKHGVNDSKNTPTAKPAKYQIPAHLADIKELVTVRTDKIPKNDAKNGALQRMSKIRKQQKDEVGIVPTKEVNNNHAEDEISQTESASDVDMMDVSFEKEPEAPVEYESMEWEDIPEEEIIEHVQNLRSTVNPEQAIVELPKSSLPDADVDFFVVVDTNVLLSNVDFLKQIKGKVFKDIGKATIFLPYVVLRELDHLKCNNSVEKQARRAIAFIDDCFKSKDTYFLGQSAIESYQKKVIPIDGNDDEILNCCLLLQEKTKKIVLLTNDKNLRNKAFVNKLESYSRDMLNSTAFNVTNQITFE